MLPKRVKAFALIELIVSIFIITGLLVIGFYSFRKFENLSSLKRGSTEVKLALETAHRYSMTIPTSIPDITQVNYIGVKFNKDASSTDITSYQYVYSKCSASLSTWDPSPTSINSCSSNKLVPFGESVVLPKNIRINNSSVDIWPLFLFSVSNSRVAGWCKQNNCPSTSPMIALSSQTNTIPLTIFLRSNTSTLLNVYASTGVIYEQ